MTNRHRWEGSGRSGFQVQMLVDTDVIGGSVLGTKYATELLTVDLTTPPVDGDLVVFLFDDGTPSLARWRCTGRGENGRFIPADRPDEEVILLEPYVTASKARMRDPDCCVRLVGRYVGPDREFPREKPGTYSWATMDKEAVA